MALLLGLRLRLSFWFGRELGTHFEGFRRNPLRHGGWRIDPRVLSRSQHPRDSSTDRRDGAHQQQLLHHRQTPTTQSASTCCSTTDLISLDGVCLTAACRQPGGQVTAPPEGTRCARRRALTKRTPPDDD